MFYEPELKFLCSALKKFHIQTRLTNVNTPADYMSDIGMRFIFGINSGTRKTIRDCLGTINPNTVYKNTDIFSCTYLFIPLPDPTNEAMLIVGPFLKNLPDEKSIMEWAERKRIPPAEQKHLISFYTAVPVSRDDSNIYALIDTFCERCFGGENSFSLVDIDNDASIEFAQGQDRNGLTDEEAAIVNMRMMEKRYEYENELMQAVSEGKSYLVDIVISGFDNSRHFEKRIADPVRNAKNYGVITNTILRKAAENGGVHPVYLDSTSSSFAAKIEQAKSERELKELMGEMFHTYCRLVKKHSMKGYSTPVQKAIICIERDISASISLSSLASMQNISAGYLSTIFKRETGKSVTEYINSKRISHAKKLLEKTKLQIQTVAQHCGILDVNYFTKVFKKYAGMTPKEYRESFKL